jgi:mRNA interferase MazF
MKIGDIVLIPFPFSEFTQTKLRPAVVIAETSDKYKDIVVSAISSVVPDQLAEREFVVPIGINNKLRANSVVKTDRIVTVKRENIVAQLGQLNETELKKFKSILLEMIN